MLRGISASTRSSVWKMPQAYNTFAPRLQPRPLTVCNLLFTMHFPLENGERDWRMQVVRAQKRDADRRG